MDKRPKQKGSSWSDESEKSIPNRRQEQDQDSNVESPRSGQRASRSDSGSSESPPSDRDEELHGERQSDTSRRQRQTEE